MKRTCLFLLLLLAACQPAPTALSVDEPWTRPSQAGGNAGVFFVVTNPGPADTLLSASGEVAEAIELHESSLHGDMMSMEMVPSVPIPAGGEVSFEPGGLHVMLIGLDRDLETGDTFDLQLLFEGVGPVTVTVTVQAP